MVKQISTVCINHCRHSIPGGFYLHGDMTDEASTCLPLLPLPRPHPLPSPVVLSAWPGRHKHGFLIFFSKNRTEIRSSDSSRGAVPLSCKHSCLFVVDTAIVVVVVCNCCCLWFLSVMVVVVVVVVVYDCCCYLWLLLLWLLLLLFMNGLLLFLVVGVFWDCCLWSFLLFVVPVVVIYGWYCRCGWWL